MNTVKRELLKNLLLTIPDNGVVCASHLLASGLSYENLKQYVHNGYLDSLGRGAYCKHGNNPTVYSALSAMNVQLGFKIHFGGRSALARRGYLHFVPMQEPKTTLFGSRDTRLPAWMKHYFKDRFVYVQSSILPTEAGLSDEVVDGFTVRTSCAERAFLEFVSGIPKRQQLNEAYQILEMMNTLRPKMLRELLLNCSSVQTKRLFMLLAEDVHHSWFDRLDVTGVDFGSGCRIVEKGGKFQSKWQVVVKDWREI